MTIQFFIFLEVVVHVEVFQVLAQDRIQQHRMWSRSLIFQLAGVFQIFSQARVPQLSHRVVCVTMQMRDFKGFFALFTFRNKKCEVVVPHSGSELLPESSPSTRRAYVDADGTPMVDDEDGNTWWESAVVSGRWYLLGSNRTVWREAPG